MKFWLNILKQSLLLLTLLGLTGVAFAKITLTLDRSDIHEHETFHLRVQVEESNTLNAGANADFIPEQITVRSRQEYNSSIIVNGQYNTQMGWDFELLATEAGTYTIPALKIGNERSEPFTIRVMPEQGDLGNAENAKIKLRATISDEEVYVQQQLIFTVRIYRSVVARNQQITPIRVTNALVEQLGENTSFDVVKNNNNFRVVEQRYAIFPQQSGDMIIEPMTYSATILEDTDNRSPWKRSQLKPISLSTQKYTVKVKPKPQNAAEPWLPATKVALEAEWQPKNQTFTVGDPANLDFIIKGTGLLKTQLPAVTFPKHDDVTIYRDTPQYRQRFNRFGVNSYHFEKVAVIPSKAGKITIPEVKIPWWNVETDQQEYAVLPAQTIQVEPSNKQITNNQSASVIPESQKKVLQQTEKTDANTSQKTSPDSSSQYWKYISLGLGVAWLLTLLLWLRNRNRSQHATPLASAQGHHKQETPQAPSASLKAVIKLANNNDTHKTATELTAWLKQSPLSNQLDPVNISQFIDYCRDNGLTKIAVELEVLQKHLYSTQAQDSWKGQELAQLLSKMQLPKANATSDTLPGLYQKRH